MKKKNRKDNHSSKRSVKSPLLRRKEIRTCINLHNDCENSDVLNEIMGPALNFGSTSVVDEPTPDPIMSNSESFEIAQPQSNNHSTFVNNSVTNNVSLIMQSHTYVLFPVCCLFKCVYVKSQSFNMIFSNFCCLSSLKLIIFSLFSLWRVSSDAATCLGSPGKPCLFFFWFQLLQSLMLTFRNMEESLRSPMLEYSCRTLDSMIGF